MLSLSSSSSSLALALLLISISSCSAFVANGALLAARFRQTSRASSSLSRTPPFQLRMAIDSAEVSKLMETIEKVNDGAKAPKPGKKVFKALKKTSGAISVATEYSRANVEPQEGEHGVDFRTFSLSLRRAKAAALLVDCSSPAGLADLEAFVAEQATAKGNFPGPVPVIRSGAVTEASHVAEAKAAGAEGVMVSMSEDKALGVVEACAALGMECVCVVSDAHQVSAALAAGSKLICTASDMDPDAALKLTEGLGKEVAALAMLDARADGGPAGLVKIAEEMEEKMMEDTDKNAPKLQVVTRAGLLRDGKGSLHSGAVNGFVLSKACNSADERAEVGFHNFLLETLQSKKSTNFAKMAKLKNPLGTGKPPVTPSGFTTVLEGSVKK